jgi:hypothetical protein
MKKLIFGLLAMLSLTAQAQTKCDWSDYYMVKSYQSQNYFQFKTNLHFVDTCVYYTWTVYDFQLKRIDTIQEIANGAIGVRFNAKGKYKVGLKAVNKCAKHGMAWCDTFFYQYIDITVYGKKASFGYKVSDTNCRAYTFEMNNMKDSCISYYYEIWDATEYAKKLSDEEWSKFSDSAIYFGYGWDEKNLKYYSRTSERGLKHTFEDSGRYIITTYWQNKCSGIDTWIWNKITVCPTKRTTSITKLKPTDIKVIGVYDMLGRPVQYMEENQIYIYHYNNGQRRKVMRTK